MIQSRYNGQGRGKLACENRCPEKNFRPEDVCQGFPGLVVQSFSREFGKCFGFNSMENFCGRPHRVYDIKPGTGVFNRGIEFKDRFRKKISMLEG
jgi:hypothetical protein